MTSWMKERDRLVEQTLAFVKGVAAQRPITATINDARPVSGLAMPLGSVVAPDLIAPDLVAPHSIAPRPDAPYSDAPRTAAPHSAAVETIAPAQPKALTQPLQHIHEKIVAIDKIVVVEPIVAVQPNAMDNETLPLRGAAIPLHQTTLKRSAAVQLPERDVITQRVARFRAGQQKLLQDREDNYVIQQARIRASLRNDPAGNDSQV